jgi:hypothetical protein
MHLSSQAIQEAGVGRIVIAGSPGKNSGRPELNGKKLGMVMCA